MVARKSSSREREREAGLAEAMPAFIKGLCDPASKRFWIWNIPIVGGFCAPSESTEKSCLRHFSNEFTLPLTKCFMRLLPCMEQNLCCVAIGKIGCACADRLRKVIMMSSCCMNLLAMFALILAAIGGLATQPAVLSKLAWVRGTGMLPRAKLEVYMGLKFQYHQMSCLELPQRTLFLNRTAGMGWSEPEQGCFERLISWNDERMCTQASQEVADLCKDCKKSLLPRSALTLSILTQLPTMATNLQRATRFGDVNCQAGMGFATNFISLFSSLITLMSFRRSCMDNAPAAISGVSLEWRAGPGLMLVFLGTLVKVIDIIVHCSVPTPRQRWQNPGPEVKDVAVYMAMAPAQRESDDKAEDDNGEAAASQA